MDDNNVTKRNNKKTSLHRSLNTSVLSTLSTQSLPDLSTALCDINELKDEIVMLQNQLEAAYEEIDNLTIENNKLKEGTKSNNLCICSTHQTQPESVQDVENNIVVNNNHKEQNIVRPDTPNSHMLITPSNSTEAVSSNPLDGASHHTFQDKSETKMPVTGALNFDPEILIIGGHQVINLASKLICSRENTMYQKYKIHSFKKPNALASDILSCSSMLSDSKENYLIISVGENDTNPFKLMTSFTSTLKSFRVTRIIILNVVQNKYLNENKLNQMLSYVCNNFDNCTFLNMSNFDMRNSVDNICKRLNFLIDMQYYTNNYLSLKKVKLCTRAVLHQGKEKSNKFRKGTTTIPYLFSLIEKNNRQKCSKNVEKITSNESPSSSFFRLGQ